MTHTELIENAITEQVQRTTLVQALLETDAAIVCGGGPLVYKSR